MPKLAEKRTKILKLLSFLLLLFTLNSPSFSQDRTPVPYKPQEFPKWTSDLHRAEIITLGAMPFVVFDVTLAYSIGSFVCYGFDPDHFVNPFSKDSDSASFTLGEQVGIIITSFGICLGIGITDFIVHMVRRSKREKQARTKTMGNIKIEKVINDPDAVKIKPPPPPSSSEPPNASGDTPSNSIDTPNNNEEKTSSPPPDPPKEKEEKE